MRATATVLLRGSSALVLEEADRSLHDVMYVSAHCSTADEC